MRNKRARRQGITHDPVFALRINRSLVDADACSTCAPGLHRFTEAFNYIRLPRPRLVLKSHQKAPFMRLVGSEVIPRPSVDINHSARPNHHVAGVTNAVSKYGPAETG